jgi:hypothetical protein
MGQWRLRESDKDVVVVNPRKYGLPTMHRNDSCRTHPSPDNPVLFADILGFDVAQLAWQSELNRLKAGLPRTIDLCVHCMSERV